MTCDRSRRARGGIPAMHGPWNHGSPGNADRTGVCRTIRRYGVAQSELDAVAQGNSRTVLVTAASGLGKSRLLLETSRIAVSHGFRVFRAQGQNQIGLAPLASLRETLSQCIAKYPSGRAAEGLTCKLELSEFARELIDSRAGTGVGTFAAVFRQNARMIFLTDASPLRWQHFFGHLGTPEKPVLILLDDMHWADDLTLTMLECWHLTNSRPHAADRRNASFRHDGRTAEGQS